MKKSLQLTYFNFDKLKEVFQKDPIAGEIMRLEVIDAFIESQPNDRQPRYRALQHGIDSWRNKTSNNTQRFDVMKARFYDLAVKFQNSWTINPTNIQPKDNILPFKISKITVDP